MDVALQQLHDAGQAASRKLLDVQLNSVDTHLAVGDVLAYDITLGVGHASQTDQATSSKTNTTTIAISQAAGLNNASCLHSACSLPTANSTGSTISVTGQLH